ncbi:nitrogen fixation protein NifH [Scytonema hofmannii PCC 7110]|uniref:Nitrogen fixation protein NifH n=1 Tax=Scytonema hofmannii PCC 7110 TaxID=128403 RepID=A0A139X296_9CYAN|nr:fdxN element excision recombinase XisF [Scytonema hofmannii]KYC38786.1 nitrogen fixation protein NifH [Scytonema hofmannii PCC 7110]
MRVGYVRVSTREQDEGNALEQQTARVEKSGAVLIFSDIESGRSDKRKEFNKMLAMCKQGKISEVVITRIDRLARSVITIHRTLVTLEEYKVKLVVLDAPVDPTSPFGWFSVNQMAGLAEFESRLLSDRIRHGLNYFREQKKAAPRPPFGYKRVDEKYAPDMTLHESGKTNWAIASEIVNYFLSGNATLRSTAQYVLETYGISWTAAGLRYWITSPVLRGHTAYNMRGNLSNPEKWEVHQDTHEPLLSNDKFKFIQKKLEDNRHKYSYGNNKNSNQEPLPLVGQIICDDCGYKCYCLKRKWKTYRIRCKKHDNLGNAFCSNNISTYLPDIISAVDATLAARYEEIKKYTVANLSSKEEENPETIARQEQLKALKLLPQNPIIQNAIEQTLLEIQVLKQKEVTAKQVSIELVKTLTTCFENIGYWNELSWVDKQPIYKELVDCVKIFNGKILEIKLLV